MNSLCHVFFDEYPKDSRIRRYCNVLIENNFDVQVISLKYKGAKKFESKERLKIYRVPLSKKRGGFLSRIIEYILFQIYAFFYIFYVMIRHNPQTYHFHTLPDFIVFAGIIPKLLGKRIILDFHELFPEFMLQTKPKLNWDSFIIKFLVFIEREAFKFADEIIAFHDPAKEILSKRIKSKKNIHVIMNGVDETELPELKKEEIEDIRLVYNGTINFNLNLEFVVLALDKLRMKSPEIFSKVSFHLYGDGPSLNQILEQSKNFGLKNVYYHGRLPFNEMMLELGKATVCVLPPKRDIYSELYYSLKLTEMIYFKIPVISSRLKTYLHYYQEDCLIYFEPGDIEDLTNKILNFAKDPKAFNSYTQRAFEAYEKYNWNIMKNKYIQLLNKG